jgi:hypothetical protein
MNGGFARYSGSASRSRALTPWSKSSAGWSWQGYQGRHHRSGHPPPSAVLVALTVFDLLVMWMIWHEYQLLRRHLPAG